MSFAFRKMLCGAALTVLTSVAASAQTAPPPAASPPAPPPEVLAEFAKPHDRIDIGGGRKINLFCMGSGERTVLFDSGGSDWSVIWGLVQPAVAKRVRACSYDRAGLGYSDPAAGPRAPIAVVEDIHALVQAAKLKTPLVIVGHSLGGFNMKLYAALYPEDVAGIVLVDPSEDRQAERARVRMRKEFGDSITFRSELGDRAFMKRLAAHYENCAKTARDRDLDAKSDTYKYCADPVRAPLGPDVAAERARIQVKRAYQEAQASEIANSVYGDASNDETYRLLFTPRRFGAKPMIVLTHGLYDPEDPLDVASYRSYLWLHNETAGLSSRGQQRVVPNTTHNIEIDAPQAIVDAIGEVLQQLDQPPTKR